MDIKSLKTRIILLVASIIVIPIAFHQIQGVIGAKMQREAMKKPVEVQTMHPLTKDIYSGIESTGRIESKYKVDVVARINGWLQKSYFAEGEKVSKGQTLFLIEPDEYQIAVNNAAAAVRQNQAVYVNAQKELQRAAELVKKDYVSKSYYDDALAARDRGLAALDSAKAQLANAKLNLGYTKITSPIDGKIGRIIITEGNLVNPSAGALAQIVSVKPIFVYFTLKSSDYMKLRKANASTDADNIEVKIKLADGSTYDENGVIEFVNNRVDETTGTVTLRATFKNDDELLIPGDFVNVTVKSKNSKNVMLLPQSSVLDDTDGYYVWVVKQDNTVEKRQIKVSDVIDNNWVVDEGLSYDDVVVAKGIQSIRMPGQKVKPTSAEEEKQSADKKDENSGEPSSENESENN